MTREELRTHFNETFGKHGIDNPWPKTYEVDAETYANVCKELFSRASGAISDKSVIVTSILLGKNYGPLFKGVELILKS